MVRGELVGANGMPMSNAHVVVDEGPVDVNVVAAADEKGRFSFQLPEPGGYGMYFTGVHHKTLEIPFVVTDSEPVELNVQLWTPSYQSGFDSVRVIGDFNDFSEEEAGVLLEKQTGGTFAAHVETSADTLAYQLTGVLHRGTLAGTKTDRYVFNEDGPFWDRKSDYISVVSDVDGSATITFDPSALPDLNAEPVVRSSNATVQSVADIYLEVEKPVQRFFADANALYPTASTDEEREAIEDSLRSILHEAHAEVARSFKERIETEQNPLLRQWLMLRYVDDLRPAEEDSMLARRALREVPPTSPFWSYEAWSRVGASNLMARLSRLASEPERVDMYMEEVIQQHPDPDVRRHFLYRGIRMAASDGDEKRKMRYYGQMMDEFADSWHAERIRREYAPDRAIQAGNSIPDFALTSLSDSSVVYTDESMRGDVYLIDAWAVWCAPCIAEMKHLHEAYGTYKEEGFDILSVSLDEEPQDVTVFREEEWPMPWKHHFAGFSGEGRKTIEETFEVVGIPHPILVDEEGTIIAAEEDVRGEKLLETLERVYGEPSHDE